MIALPIGHPIGSDRHHPNRPRIAHIESSRVGPSIGNLGLSGWLNKSKSKSSVTREPLGLGAAR